MSEELKAAQARIACLEGEIAKRDEELAACRIAVENCEVFRARIAELEQDLAYFPSTVRSLAETVTEREAEINQLRAELSALKAQEPVIDAPYGGILRIEAGNLPDSWVRINPCKLYAAPVSEAKEQGVVMPDVNAAAKALCNRHAMICGVDADDQWKEYSQDFIADAETVLANARLYAAPAAPAADAGLVEALELAANRLDRLALEQGEFWRGYATAWADEARAAHRSTGVV